MRCLPLSLVSAVLKNGQPISDVYVRNLSSSNWAISRYGGLAACQKRKKPTRVVWAKLRIVLNWVGLICTSRLAYLVSKTSQNNTPANCDQLFQVILHSLLYMSLQLHQELRHRNPWVLASMYDGLRVIWERTKKRAAFVYSWLFVMASLLTFVNRLHTVSTSVDTWAKNEQSHWQLLKEAITEHACVGLLCYPID